MRTCSVCGIRCARVFKVTWGTKTICWRCHDKGYDLTKQGRKIVVTRMIK